MSFELLQTNVIKFLGKQNVLVIPRLMVNSNLLRTQKLFAREAEHKLVLSKGQLRSQEMVNVQRAVIEFN